MLTHRRPLNPQTHPQPTPPRGLFSITRLSAIAPPVVAWLLSAAHAAAAASFHAPEDDAREPSDAASTPASADDSAPDETAGPSGDPPPIDTAAALIDALADSYAERAPWAVAVEVTAGAGEIGRSETIRLWLDDSGDAALLLSPISINVRHDRIDLAHDLDIGSYAVAAEIPTDVTDADEAADDERADGGADQTGEGENSTPHADQPARSTNPAIALLRRSLPPVYDLPLHLALAGDHDLSQPTAFTDGVRWSDPQPDERGRLVMQGVFPLGSVRLVASPDPWRVRSFEVRFHEGDRLLRFEHRAIRSPARLHRDRWLFDTDARRRLESLSDLGPRPGDVGVGRALPPMPVQDAADVLGGIRAGIAPPDPPLAMLVFGESADADTLAPAVAAVADADPPFRLWPVVVLDVTDPPVSDEPIAQRLQRARDAVGREPLAFSLSADRSIRRFIDPAPDASRAAVLVTVDQDGRVAGVVRLDHPAPHAAPAESDALEHARALRLLLQRAIERAHPTPADATPPDRTNDSDPDDSGDLDDSGDSGD